MEKTSFRTTSKKIITFCHCISPYYDECKSILKENIVELVKQRLTQPITNLEGELYALNVTNDWVHNKRGYPIQELYIPYFFVSMNVAQGFNGFLNISNNRYKETSKMLKKIEISEEMANTIHSMVNDLVNNRPLIEKFITNIIKDEDESSR